MYEKRGGRIFVVLLGKKTAKGKVRYHLPKGTLRFNETLEHGAKREVLEESGCRVKIEALLGGMTNKYIGYDGLMTEKTVIFFAMKKLADTKEHDNEYDFVKYLPIDVAIRKLKKTEPKKREYIIVKRLKQFLEAKNSK